MSRGFRLEGHDNEKWWYYNIKLEIDYIHLNDEEDSLVWWWKPIGDFSTSLGYKSMFMDGA